MAPPPSSKFYSSERSNQQKRKSVFGFMQKLKPAKPSDEFTPESIRRFLFDDKAALYRDSSMRELFRAEEPPEVDFNDIVDSDDRRVEVFVSQELVGRLIDSGYFKAFIFGLIVVNAILIGLQTVEKWSVDYRELFSVFDQLVIAIFICEILLKWYYGFWVFWKVGWNVGDFLVISALVFGPQLAFLSSSRILRILRVVRAFRSLRSVSALAGLSMVIQTILQSVPDMANIMGLCIIIFLVLGVSGVTLFSKYVPGSFGDLPTAMYTLFICFTQDGWIDLYKDFEKQGIYIGITGALFFVLSITIGAFIFANLVVAVVVTNLELAMNQMKAEKNSMIDTLDIIKHSQEDEDVDNKDKPLEVPVLEFSLIERNFSPSSQTMLQFTNLKGLNTEKITSYFVLLMALEENLSEYEGIKEDLRKIHAVVDELNNIEQDEDADMGSREQIHTMRAEVQEIQQTLKKGDILSNLMKLEERALASSKDKDSLGVNLLKGARSSSVSGFGRGRPRARSMDVASANIARRMSLRVQGNLFQGDRQRVSEEEEQDTAQPGTSSTLLPEAAPSGSGRRLAHGRRGSNLATQAAVPLVADLARPMRRGAGLLPERAPTIFRKESREDMN